MILARSGGYQLMLLFLLRVFAHVAQLIGTLFEALWPLRPLSGVVVRRLATGGTSCGIYRVRYASSVRNRSHAFLQCGLHLSLLAVHAMG